MAKLVATQRGYALGRIIEPGEEFSYPDEEWADEKRRPTWAKLAKVKLEPFGGKGDHDGDGKAGGTKPALAVVVPADWHSFKSAELKALAKAISGETAANIIEARAVIEAHVEATKAAPFADAPEPVTIKPGNGLGEALGTNVPDWVDPASGVPGGVPAAGVAGNGSEQPEPADE
jgi:hypothetical protein